MDSGDIACSVFEAYDDFYQNLEIVTIRLRSSTYSMGVVYRVSS